MSTKARAKPQRDRHQEIVEAAAQVITDRGLAETRIQDIADRCGVSPGLILYYFGSKDRLLVEALTYANDQSYLRMSRELRKMPAASERMDRLIQLSVPGLLPEYALLDEWALWLEIWVRALRDPEISEVIRYGRQTGEFPSDAADADDIAMEFGAMVDGLAIQVLLNDTVMTPSRMRDICVDVARRLIGYDGAR